MVVKGLHLHAADEAVRMASECTSAVIAPQVRLDLEPTTADIIEMQGELWTIPSSTKVPILYYYDLLSAEVLKPCPDEDA
ncbi:hypothetical protein chiPu_0016204 [Chiloscyllium punctatum]|uniref:Uncharacterized protein n=1 Tax=Chiloscyllium punctatum TaxID=137246 RepID=A0A401T4X0_CHIPU|nr:hypothetical protein [Chiloscyllium punctatum]